MRLKKVPLVQSVGQPLAHDLTRIVPGQVKETAFRRGQVVKESDLEMLKDMGRESLYVMGLGPEELHENDAAIRLAQIIAGPGLEAGPPAEGKVNLSAAHEGLFKVKVKAAARLNAIPPLTLSTLHTNSVLKSGQLAASAKIVPLAVRRRYLDRAERLKDQVGGPLVELKPFLPLKVGAIITGSEILSGRIENGFGRLVAPRITRYGAKIIDEQV
ncbi:MAG: molybdopterin-binding protein, partial [Deltaproteobacteria bacterium]|nr:molybdopterin-binding protein [Deltaproteobacteria bacterium]